MPATRTGSDEVIRHGPTGQLISDRGSTAGELCRSPLIALATVAIAEMNPRNWTLSADRTIQDASTEGSRIVKTRAAKRYQGRKTERHGGAESASSDFSWSPSSTSLFCRLAGPVVNSSGTARNS